ncbi:hypothetical protein ANCCAN_19003 [Ancylostoma caninum]|uniref:Uncharacterized protein n=1 Tax=Ancylostoma caninum TaxID=29170 RepID=A0A368FWI7_ANCCA|nr:hypothetical protein ANCCAN_19003 [Ancylostoma caninum]
MESVLHLLELISQNPTQPTSDPSFPTSNAPVVSSSMQPAVNGSDPAVARESSSYDSLNHVVQVGHFILSVHVALL